MPQLKEIFAAIQEQSLRGNRRGLMPYLHMICQNKRQLYQHSLQERLLEEYADALYKSLLLELDENEEESIEMAELTYLALSILIQTEQPTPMHYKQRILLLHYFCDYFTDAIITIFFNHYRDKATLQARSMAVTCIEKMQLSDLFFLEKMDQSFIDQDEQLIDACNSIETDPHLTPEEKTNAELLHRVLQTYLTTKYKN